MIKRILGRFTDCLTLWLLAICDNTTQQSPLFWSLLSRNATHKDYFVYSSNTIFSEYYPTVVWSHYEADAWEKFVKNPTFLASYQQPNK